MSSTNLYPVLIGSRVLIEPLRNFERASLKCLESEQGFNLISYYFLSSAQLLPLQFPSGCLNFFKDPLFLLSHQNSTTVFLNLFFISSLPWLRSLFRHSFFFFLITSAPYELLILQMYYISVYMYWPFGGPQTIVISKTFFHLLRSNCFPLGQYYLFFENVSL